MGCSQSVMDLIVRGYNLREGYDSKTVTSA
jgi:hypothetical protein